MMKKWEWEFILEGLVYCIYIMENINGDICLLGEIFLMKVVNIIWFNGDYRYIYEGKVVFMF